MSGFWFDHYSRALGCYLVTSRVSDDLFRAAVSQDRFLFLPEAVARPSYRDSGISSQSMCSYPRASQAHFVTSFIA